MNVRKYLLFSVILLGLISYIAYIELPKGEVEAKKDFVLPRISKDEIRSIEIKRKAGQIVLNNLKTDVSKPEAPGTNPEWELSGIKGAAVDPARINSLLAALSDLKRDYTIPPAELESDLSVYGLKDPELTLKAIYTNGDTEVLFGKKNEYTRQRYFMISGSPGVFLGSDTVFSSSDKSAEDFRDRNPLSFSDSKIKALTVALGDSHLRAEADENRRWKLTEPDKASGSAKEVAEYLRNLKNVKAESFDDTGNSDLSKFGLSKPKVNIKLEFVDSDHKPPLEIQFGSVRTGSGKDVSETTWFKSSNGPTIYKATENPLEKLSKHFEDLRETELFSFVDELVKEAKFEGELSGNFSIIKEDAGWKVNGKNGDPAFVTQLLKDLASVKAVSFPSKGDTLGFESPRMKVTLKIDTLSGDPAIKTFTIGAKGPKGSFAAAGDLSEPFVISEEVLHKIIPREDALLKVEPTPGITPTPSTK